MVQGLPRRQAGPQPQPQQGAQPSPGGGLLIKKNRHSRVSSVVSVNSLAPSEEDEQDAVDGRDGPDRDDEFLLGAGYKPPKGLKKFLSIRLGDWPIYSFILAAGQILAANSYQIVLLAGEAGQTATQLYIVSGSYGVTSLLWWLMFRRLQALYALSLPWFFSRFRLLASRCDTFHARKHPGSGPEHGHRVIRSWCLERRTLFCHELRRRR